MANGQTKAKEKKYFVSFNKEWATKYNSIKKSHNGKRFAFCTMCGNDFGKRNDIKRQLETLKHKTNAASFRSSCSLTDWVKSTATNKLDEKVSQAELLFSGFIAEHNFSIATADRAGSLFREMFPNSKITTKYKCKRTKTTYVLTGAVAKNNIEELSKYLQSSWYGLATDGSSDETDKYLSVLVRYEEPNGLSRISLLDMPDFNVGSDTQAMFNTIDYAIKSAKLSWDNCVTYSSDNTNLMIEKKNSLLTKIKNSQQCGQSMFDAGCPCHLAHLCAEQEVKRTLSTLKI